MLSGMLACCGRDRRAPAAPVWRRRAELGREVARDLLDRAGGTRTVTTASPDPRPREGVSVALVGAGPGDPGLLTRARTANYSAVPTW